MTPLIFFVHVPKTAGTTINAHLAEAMPGGRAHCETIINDPDALRAAAREKPWLSGHVNFRDAQEKIAAVTDRPVRYFTCMRDPKSQIISHYNWILEIYHKGPAFYRSHPLQIRELSQRVRESDNTNPSVVIENLLVNPYLFLNMQSRVILGARFPWNEGKIYQQLGKYEMVATESSLDRLIEAMIGHAPDEVLRENASPYRIDPAVFDSVELVEFLKTNHTLDNILYGLLQK